MGSSDTAAIAVMASARDPVPPHSTKKALSWWGILAAGYNVCNSWLVFVATLTISLPYGPMNTIWGLIATTVGYTCIGLTLAELVSAWPTAGGQYHWTYILAPKWCRRFLSYTCGIISWFSWLCMAAASMGALSNVSFVLIQHQIPSFESKPWQLFLFYQAVNVLSLFCNLCLYRSLSKVYIFGFWLSIISFVTITASCLALQHDKASSSFVWFNYNDASGWPTGVAFLISMTAPVISIAPLDGAVHLVNEVKSPAKVVPQTIITALVISFITTFVFALAMLYSIMDFDSLLGNPSYFMPFDLWIQATHSDAAAIAFTSTVIVMLPIGSIACVQVDSIMLWSLAQDKAVPYHRIKSGILASYNNVTVPQTAALLTNAFLMFLIGILYLFSTLAFNAMVSSAVILQQITFLIPTVCLLYRARSAKAAPFTLQLPSWLGWGANVGAVIFILATEVFFMLPATKEVNSSTMNYAVVVLSCLFVCALLNWFVYARNTFEGPKIDN